MMVLGSVSPDAPGGILYEPRQTSTPIKLQLPTVSFTCNAVHLPKFTTLQVCAVQLEYFHNTSHAPDHYALLTKSCMAFDDCTALQNENAEFCTLHWTPRCAYCYESMYGNYQHPFPNPDSLLFRK